MKSGKSKKRKYSKQTRLTCPKCDMTFYAVNHYKDHMKSSKQCHSFNPYCCKFCEYVGSDSNGLNQHLMKNPACSYHYEELKVTTGLLPNIGKEINIETKRKNISSYTYPRYLANGVENDVQIHLHDETIDKQQYIKAVNLVNAKSMDDLTATYHLKRLLACMDNTNIDCDINEEMSVDHNVSDSEESTQLEELGTMNASQNDLRLEQEKLNKRFSKINITKSNEMQLDLFHILKASNAPLVMFDRINHWLRRHEGTIQSIGLAGLSNRDKFISDMNQILYKDCTTMKPLINTVHLSSGRTTNVVTFSFREMILRMVTNRSLFTPENLLLSPENPFSDPADSLYYSDVNSGTWYKEAKLRECSKPNHILMPFCYFIDGLNVDKYGKITVEAVMTCCLWFNRKARNRSSTWWVQGFIEDQNLFRDQDCYVRNEKAQDYHDMITCIFKEMKDIRDDGGIKLTLDFGESVKHDVIAIPVIQFIIGDCKGNDLLCGRKGGHSLLMNGLCRDCNIQPMYADDTCIGKELRCKFITLDDVKGKDEKELERYSFLPIKNCFHDLSFGGCNRNIYGATPAELLHAVLLGLCEYIAEGMDLLFTKSATDLVSSVVIGIYNDCRRQSERDLPDLGPFRNGIMSVKALKAKERFARIYCIYLALHNSYLIDELCKKRLKKVAQHGSGEFFSKAILFKFFKTVEDTLIFHLWLKQDKFLKTDFEVRRRDVDSKAEKRIKLYLEAFKDIIVRAGNNLQTPKFHQMLHISDYIKRHGCPMNYDGSRGENFGKIKIKDNARLTNKQKGTLNYDIGRRISEEDVIDQVSNVYYQRNGYWPSSFCNEMDIMHNAKRIQLINNGSRENNPLSNRRPRYILTCDVTSNEHDDNIAEEVDVHIDWGGQTKTPCHNFPRDVLQKLAHRLFVGSPNIGGILAANSKVKGYTELKKDSILYRAHPSYKMRGDWYDWGLFNWAGFSDPIPAKMIMIIDLTECVIQNVADFNPDEPDTIAQDVQYPHLTSEMWVVVLAGKGSTMVQDNLSPSHFNSKLSTWFELCDDTDVYIVPWSTLVGPCFIFENKNYNGEKVEGKYQCDRKACKLLPMCQWGDKFLS